MNNKENNNIFRKVGGMALVPLVGTAKLFGAPFMLPFKFGKSIYNTVRYASGHPDQEVNSFDVWYEKLNINEQHLAYQYRKNAINAWVAIVMMFIAIAAGFYTLTLPVLLPMKIAGFMPVLVSFSLYFQFVVFAHCFKVRSYDRKLDAFKSIDGILPNPYCDIVEATVKYDNKIKKNVPVKFYPAGKKILKKNNLISIFSYANLYSSKRERGF